MHDVAYVFSYHRHNMLPESMNILAGNSKWAGLHPVVSIVM